MKFPLLSSSVLLYLMWSLALLISGCGGVHQVVPAQAMSPSQPAAVTPADPPTSPSLPITSLSVPRSKHVVLVIEENHSFSEVHDGGMPWLVQQGRDYAFAANYRADAVGSALDYFWLSSGSSEQEFGCAGWGCSKPITSDNIFRALNRGGLTWKVYAESLPQVGWMKGDSGAYAVRHNPAAWYSDVIDSAVEQCKMVPFAEFTSDVARNQLPNYSLIIPNLDHDAHNGTLLEADQWLQSNLGPLLQQPYFQPGGDGLMIVTFDECDAAVGNCPEQVYTAVIGPNVKHSYKSSQSYRHENTLRTMLEALRLDDYPGAAQEAEPMLDFFQ